MTNALTGLILGAALLAPAPLPSHPGPVAPQDDPGAAVFKRVCSSCHTPERIVAVRRSADQWQEVMENMISRGAQGSDDDLNTVFDYLLAHVGRVNVNREDAATVASVLALTPADAQKIVDFRKAHGPFAGLDALAAVPGLDAAHLRTLADAVTF